MANTTELKNKRTSRRTPISGSRNVLTVQGKEPGYEYRIVNDTGDRISQMEDAGYEVVQDQNITVGDRRISNPTKEGSPVKVSVGGGQQAYVMRIKKEWYEEDKAAKAARVDEIEKGTLREAKQNSDYGKITI
jgi:hypothetical protein